MELILAQMSEEEKIREQCFAREDYERRMSSMHASGFNQGLELGISQGRISQLVALVNDGLLSLANAASSANMTEEDFSKLL